MTGITSFEEGFQNTDKRCPSRKERKRFVKREKRRIRRQLEARQREKEQENGELTPSSEQQAEEHERHLEQLQEEERKRQHELWLQREHQAQEEFRKQQEKEEMIKKKEEEERKRIQAEWEEQQRQEQEKLKKEKEQKDKKHHQLEGVMQYLDKGAKNGEGHWRNPDAPPIQPGSRKSQICSFYMKTGVCRFGERCSRSHPDPGISRTVLLRGMYVNFAMEQSYHDDHNDVSLEYDQETAQEDFEEFYLDVLPEFAKIGRVIVLKVCCNWERHLRGNVYVQYQRDEDAVKAVEAFNGRFYAGRALSCEHVAVEDWRTAVCGLFQYRKCPKGKNCNFLHVFKNPGEHLEQKGRQADYSSRHSRHRLGGSGWRSYSRSSTRSVSRSSSRWSRDKSSRSTSRPSERYHYSRKSHSRARSQTKSRSRSPRRRAVKTPSYRSRSRAERSRSRSSSSRSRSRSPAKRSRSRSRSNSPRSRSVKRSRGRSRSPTGSRSRSISPEPSSLKKPSSPSGSRSGRAGRKSQNRSRSASHSRSRSGSPSESRSQKKTKNHRRKKRKRKHRRTKRASLPKLEREDRFESGQNGIGTSPNATENKEATSSAVPGEVNNCDEGSLSGDWAESEDSNSSIEERMKLDIVEQEIARLSQRASEQGNTAAASPGQEEEVADNTPGNPDTLQEQCGDNGLADEDEEN